MVSTAGCSHSERNASQYVVLLSNHLVGSLVQILIRFDPDIAKEHPYALELNVLVIGLPNVGKSTLLNALRNTGIKGRQYSTLLDHHCITDLFHHQFNQGTPKAFQTSGNPGMTQSLSTRLRLSIDPLVYAYDSPGVMPPFLGRGTEGAERGVKLALIGTLNSITFSPSVFMRPIVPKLTITNSGDQRRTI